MKICQWKACSKPLPPADERFVVKLGLADTQTFETTSVTTLTCCSQECANDLAAKIMEISGGEWDNA